MAGADPAQWHRAPPPAGTFQCGGLDGWPWFVSAEGRVMRLFRGAAFDEVARIPSLKAAELHALPGGYVLSVPHRRFLRVLRSLDPTNCAIGWRRRGPFAVRGALGDIVLLAPDPADLRTTIAIDAESGAELWNHAVPAGEMVSVVARVGDWVWLSMSGRLLIALHARSGAETARIEPGRLFSSLLPDNKGYAHLLSHTSDHWLADLRDGSIKHLRDASRKPPAPSSAQALLALDEGSVLTRDRAGRIHRLGEGARFPAQTPGEVHRLFHGPPIAQLHRFGSREPQTMA
jgi:hypothetical protein